jgi:hypothetical protein
MLAVFLLAVAPSMHGYWNYEGKERYVERLLFLRDVGLLATSLIFLALSGETWAYALNIGL